MRLPAIALLLSLAAGSVQAATPEQEIASARPAIEAANADWIPAMKAHDAARIASAYADDGLFILPDGTVIAGRAAIQASTEKRFTSGSTILSGGLAQDGLGYADGGLVIEWGHGGLTSKDPSGQTHSSSGPYLTVWKRDATGRWRIIRNLVF